MKLKELAGIIGLTAVGNFYPAFAEPAIGQFELKTLHSAPGYLEFQSQNAHSWGHPRRLVEDDGGEITADENDATRQRHALELEYGVTSRFKTRIGIEFEKERVDDPETFDSANAFDELKLTEFGAESIVILLPTPQNGFGLGVVVEYEHPRDSAEASTILGGPILEFNHGAWSASALVSFVRFFGGDGEAENGRIIRDNKWDLGFALQLAYVLNNACTLAFEAYGTVDRLGNSGSRNDATMKFGDFDQYRLGPIFYSTFKLGADRLAQTSGDGSADYDEGIEATFGVGLLVGVNDNTPDTTLKWSLEVEF